MVYISLRILSETSHKHILSNVQTKIHSRYRAGIHFLQQSIQL